MKLTKPLFISIAGLIVSMTGLLQAQGIHASLSISGGPPASPQWIGTTNWILYTANGGVTSDNCEAMPAPTNKIYSWGSTYGTWVTATNSPAHWTNIFPSAGWYTNVITCGATFQGTDCEGTNYTVGTNACLTNVILVESVTLSNVTFSGSKFHQVYSDSDGTDYPSPQWTPTTNYAICYTRSNSMTVQPTFVVTPSTLSILVKGISSGPQLTNATGASPVIVSTNTFHNYVDFLNKMTIDWQVSIDNGTNWHDIATSSNQVYVTLNDPTCAKLFHTVVHLACSKSGAADTNTAVANTWSLFGGSGPANVTTWNGKPLYYYKTNCGWANSATDTGGLLSSADGTNAWAGHGQCGSFAYVLHDSLAANGIASTKITLYPADGSRFTVNNWTLGRPSFQNVPGFPPYIYWLQLVSETNGSLIIPGMSPPPSGNIYRDLTKLAALPGQNTAPPSEEAFGLHIVVRYPPITGIYLDPSYGVMYLDDDDFEAKSVAGYYMPAPGGTLIDFEWMPATGMLNITNQEKLF